MKNLDSQLEQWKKILLNGLKKIKRKKDQL